MKKILILFLLSAFLINGCTTKKNSEDNTIDVSGLQSLIKKKDYTLVYFWTTWCGPCRKTLSQTLPEFEKTINPATTQLVVVAVSKDDEKINKVLGKSSLSADKYKLAFSGPDVYLAHKVVLKQTLEDLFPNDKVWRNGVPVFVLVNKDMKVLDPKLSTKLAELKDKIKTEIP
ncbi:thioredoxin-like domain-containing protein [Rubrolithibacter danxiaensis]|uniref:thioredoxin-like domain-containing protein n=1 Tax=Rubrolithibacter danxiaensis TaxID=3390805 RepID=UPI003BF8DE8C